jgi:hypothetical protein
MTSARSLPLHRHPQPHRELVRRYKTFFANREAIYSVGLSVVLLGASWFVNYFAITFATGHMSNSVTDLVLSNIPVFNVADFFVYGTFVYGIVSLLLVLAHPKRIPFAFKSVALFWVIRSAFTTLTHAAPFEAHYVTNFGPTITTMFFGADLFFSAHTGMPFLGALAFWKEKGIRLFYLLGSVYFAVIVLLGHLHYSIDVAAAYFITYSIFELAVWLMPEDRRLFLSDLPEHE